MIIYIYNDRYISNDEEIMMEFIEEQVGMDNHSISTVESIASQKWLDHVKEVPCSFTGLFDLMRKGFIFVDMCGVE